MRGLGNRARLIGATVLALGHYAAPAAAQAPTGEEVQRVRQVETVLSGAATTADPVLWPGFRPDTMALQFVLPGRGALLTGWSGPAPSGYGAVVGEQGLLWKDDPPRAAASTAVVVEGKRVAQLVVADTSLSALSGLAAHEAFHVFQRSVSRAEVRFGRGENSYYISRYPVFDVDNTTGVALEGELLREALLAGTPEAARSAGRAFVAVRESRHRGLDANVAEFEAMAELNEGLAEYIQMRVAAAVGGAVPAHALSDRLQNVTANMERSVRLRYYVTGAAQALLLDRIGPPDWKRQLMSRNVRLHDLLAESAGARDEERAVIGRAERAHDAARLISDARVRTDSLRVRLRERVEEVVTQPGTRLVVDASASGTTLNACGFDPQNLLQVGDGRLLHTRMLNACGNGASVRYATPVVEDPTGGTFHAVIPAGDTLRLTASGVALDLEEGALHAVTDLRVESEAVTATLPRARIRRTGSTLTITLLPPLGNQPG